VLRPRVLIYTVVLLAICAAFVTSLALRSPFRVDVVRDRGALARIVDEGRIENVYRLQVMNATESMQSYRVGVEGVTGATIVGRADFQVGPAEARWVPVGVQVDPDTAGRLGPGAHPVQFVVERVADDGAPPYRVNEKTTFIVPR